MTLEKTQIPLPTLQREENSMIRNKPLCRSTPDFSNCAFKEHNCLTTLPEFLQVMRIADMAG